MHHFFVSENNIDLENKRVYIEGTDVNHIKNVLRMKIGEEMLVSDGNGHDYLCEIEKYDENDSVISVITDDTSRGVELPSKIYLFQGLPKGDKMELIIQKAVELGVYEIIPVSTKRTVVKLNEKKEKSKIERYNKISESAAKQSKRSIIPEVKGVMTFKDALKYASEFDINLIPYENYKDMTETKQVIDEIGTENIKSIGIFIGPEGGFEKEEVDMADDCGFKRISLGKRILRTETAGLMILSVIGFKIELENNNGSIL